MIAAWVVMVVGVVAAAASAVILAVGDVPQPARSILVVCLVGYVAVVAALGAVAVEPL